MTKKNEDYYVLWTQNGCIDCMFLKAELIRKKINFKEINLSEKPHYRDYFYYKKWCSVPRLTYKSKELLI